MKDALANYRQLVAKVDSFCRSLHEGFPQQMHCRAGCDACCRPLSLFPVEAAALAEALLDLSPEDADHIRTSGLAAGPDRCPLLNDGLCALYDARPLICRTHGMPLIVTREGGRQVDCCTLNFQGVDSMPGSAVLDLDRLNEALVTINALFVAEGPWAGTEERVAMADALLLGVTRPDQ